MYLLAEISDKMPTIIQMWLALALMGVMLSLPGVIHRYIAILMFIIGVIISIDCIYTAYHDAFIEPIFSQHIQDELGTSWIVHSLISSFCPAVLTGLILGWRCRKQTVPEESCKCKLSHFLGD